VNASITVEWIVLILLGAVLVVFGLLFERHILVVLALPFLLVAVSSLLIPFRIPEIVATRSLSRVRVSDGESTEVEITIANPDGPICYVDLRTQDAPPGKQAPLFSGALDQGAAAHCGYRLKLPRGHYNLRPIELRFRDPLGLRFFHREVAVHTGLTVWPRVERLSTRDFAGVPAPSIEKIGQSSTTRSGNGTEWLGIRRYYPGDPLRRINWRAWARTRQLFTNDYAFERSIDSWVILDARDRSEVRRREESLFEYTVSAAASICRALIDSGNRAALYVYGAVIDDFVPLGAGPRHVQRIMNRLSTVAPVRHVAFATLSNFPTRLIRPGHDVYFVSPLAAGDTESIERLAIAGYRFTIVSPDPIAFVELKLRSDAAAGEAAWRISRLERRSDLLGLIRSGCTVVDWPTDESLSTAVSRSMRGRR